LQALEEQIHIKEAKKAIEEEVQQLYDLETLRILRQLEIRENENRLNKEKRQEEMNQFRAQNQKKTERREFDLNDPEALKKDLPARIGDDDPRCSVSGSQVYFGEDLQYKDRIKNQQHQMKVWIQEKLQQEQARKHQERAQKE
jgi:hypothetical protein